MIQRYGLWSVSTEGDVEGRSTRQLGEFRGNFDEIAFFLANQCYYTLDFRLIDDTKRVEMAPTGVSVNIRVTTPSFSPYAGLRNKDRMQQTREVAAALADTNVGVESGNYYESVQLNIDRDTAKMRLIREAVARDAAVEKARSKLTKEELELLGIK